MRTLWHSDFRYLLLLVPLVIILVANRVPQPFDKIVFIEDHPGAGERYTSFTPVLRDDTSNVVGPTAGADYGVINYRDCDGDGIPEAVVETKKSLASGEYRGSSRTVYKYYEAPDGGAYLEIIGFEFLPESDPDWQGREASAASCNCSGSYAGR